MSTKRKIVTSIGVLFLALVIWISIPIYYFLAYADGSTLPATPWVTLPKAAPMQPYEGDSPYKEVGNSLLAVMDGHRQSIGAAGISAAVLVGSEVVWAGTTGWASIENNAPATPATRFRIGSTSKALTATGLARVIESGNLTLDTPMRELWNEVPNKSWEDITPRQLGSHMAGLPHYGENKDIGGLWQSITMKQHFDSVHDAVSLFNDSQLLFEPGTDFHYSTYGTVLNSAAMSKAMGKPYLKIMHELVFEPAGMNTVIVAPSSEDELPNVATPYHNNGKTGDEFRLRPWHDVDLSHRLAGGGFAATSTDLVKLGRHYFADSNSNTIPGAISAEFWTPQKLVTGEVNEQGYGIGFRVREEEFLEGQTFKHVNHGGVSRGGQSWLMLLPEEEMAIALNINGRTEVFWDFGSFSTVIAAAFLTQKLALESESMQTSIQD
ncbi:MAG: hypothetical protein COA96_15280 [SAR86 cluster bacterium]|uniref:Beta-lactamase-related domain-containing protein n=1 Tax=SAR86 cluster bacterium TaxID=2030880 RepID=A0A2A5ARV3_9GAMM|nr:MAG: hypothetical protein COA96_15280 [SAR86 cluster bacterium]